MKMPEGLLYLQSLYEIQHTAHARECVYEAVGQLKFMAEALELVCTEGITQEEVYDKCEAALKDFQEWK